MSLPAKVVETHVSTLFFVGDRVYKLKKPVRFPFLDLSAHEARKRACRREVDLNRRLSPDVYLGVADVIGPDGEVCDHLVVMRRMPEDRKLSTLLAAGGSDRCLRAVARKVAAFHAEAMSSTDIARAATCDAVADLWERNFGEMQPYAGRLLPHDDFEEVGILAREYLAGRARLFDARIRAGRARDGHGDLLAEDIFCLDDGPRMLDCLEFDDGLRYGDVLLDTAFLAMDLERLGRPEAAVRFMSWYREFSGDTYPQSLVQHYVAYRALVRAKIACIRADAGERAASSEALALLHMARAHLRRGCVKLVLVGGLPGTGKSTLACGIADARGYSLLRSDEIRKDLVRTGQVRAAASFRSGIYRTEVTERTYAAMLERADQLLSMGHSVVLDASWISRTHRTAARALARITHSELAELACVAPTAVCISRMVARSATGGDVSDATPQVAAAMALRADRWRSAIPIDTSGPPQDSLSTALSVLDARPATARSKDAFESHTLRRAPSGARGA